MLATPILHKPVAYGSAFLDSLFVAGISLHAATALVALIFGLFALAVRKGGPYHLRYGRRFVLLLSWTVVTGIVLDIVRLSVCVAANHSKYPDYAMPSSYPARFAFLFAGFCVLHLIHRGGPRVVLARTKPLRAAIDRLTSIALIFAGLALTVLIVLRYNPWTGALWMIWTFLVLVFGVVKISTDRGGWQAEQIAMHRFCMLFLISFCAWGAVQGFGPAVLPNLNEAANPNAVYTGDQSGNYGPAFWWFLVGWAPFFLVGAYWVRRFSHRRAMQVSD